MKIHDGVSAVRINDGTVEVLCEDNTKLFDRIRRAHSIWMLNESYCFLGSSYVSIIDHDNSEWYTYVGKDLTPYPAGSGKAWMVPNSSDLFEILSGAILELENDSCV